MGFRKDSYATIWSVEPVSDTFVKSRISISRKNKETNTYETDFSGFVSFVGTAAAKQAASLKVKDRIKLGDVDVTTKYDKEKNVTYTTFKIFNFTTQGRASDGANNTASAATGDPIGPAVDDGEVEDDLPF